MWLPGVWFGCLEPAGLSAFTPLELVPLPLETVPRGGSGPWHFRSAAGLPARAPLAEPILGFPLPCRSIGQPAFKRSQQVQRINYLRQFGAPPALKKRMLRFHCLADELNHLKLDHRPAHGRHSQLRRVFPAKGDVNPRPTPFA